jgi:hypothetical protein
MRRILPRVHEAHGICWANEPLVLHAHYFVLEMFFFLVLALLEKSFQFSNGRSVNVWILTYHIGLNITAAGLLLRGLAQATGAAPSPGWKLRFPACPALGILCLERA